MGFFGNLWKKAPDIASNVLSGGLTSITQSGLNMGFNAAFGPETPRALSGHQQGQNAANYYDAAFPGTTPWERLGTSNPAGATGIADQSIKQQEKLQQNLLNNQTSIAAMQTDQQDQASRRTARATALQIAAKLDPASAKDLMETVENGTGELGEGVTGRMGEREEASYLLQTKEDIAHAIVNNSTAALTQANTAIMRLDLDQRKELWHQYITQPGVAEALDKLGGKIITESQMFFEGHFTPRMREALKRAKLVPKSNQNPRMPQDTLKGKHLIKQAHPYK